MPITTRQQEILDFIEEAQRTSGITPSTREIQHRFGFASRTGVVNHLKALSKKGAIQKSEGKARALVLPSSLEKPFLASIPIYGTIPAGIPTDQQQENEGCLTVDVESLKIPKGARVFALKIRGDSMTGASICDGDTVVLEHKEARNKDIVAALIDGESTLKRYVVQRGKPFLRAENSKYQDLIPAQELVIQGVAIAVFRSLK